MNTSWSKLIYWSIGLLALSLVPLVVGWGSMPDPMATHWGFNGVPNGSLPRWAVGLLPVLMIAVGLLTTSLFRHEGRPTVEAVAIVGLMGGISVSLMVMEVVLNWGAESWEQAEPFTWLTLVWVVGFGFGVGALGYWLGLRWYPRPASTGEVEGPILEVGDGENVSWTGMCAVTWPLFSVGLVGLVFLFMPSWWKLMTVVFVVLAFLFMRVYVTVNDEGMRVKLGGGLPARNIPLEKIKSAEAIDLEPAQWGGWGYRAVPGGWAVVLRRGDAIQVNLTNDKKYAVTVDDAATGAALLNGLVARRERQTSV